MRALLIGECSGGGLLLSRRLERFSESVVHASNRESALHELRDPTYRIVVIDMSTDFARQLAGADGQGPAREGATVVHVYRPPSPATASLPPEDPLDAETPGGFDEGLIGRSAEIAGVRQLIESYGAVEAPVLISGETGTGKELVARAVHRASPRRGCPFVAVNCAAISASIFESEVFGSVRGAFTGAVRDHGGLIGAARSGTLFLDEVGELGAELQAKLLRLLEDGSYRRVGETREARADVRVVAATNRDLLAASQSGAFRTDLFFRLDVLRIEIPPLRERRGDISLLVGHFLSAGKPGRHPRQPTTEALKQLMAYPWPGNVRELKHTVERTLAHRATGPIGRFELRSRWMEPALGIVGARITLQSLIDALERQSGQVGEVAQEFDVSVRTIQRRMAKLGLRLRDFRPARKTGRS
ncbi:MAG: sigma-54-dependent Fis family transcriptional regulator [Deltaproteobacteria bacterium]|nr:sigma-54-dependent Fis family transcriptional regulator [Deltaproteobacteria bacterium]MBW2419137.1 sigma-54-dependent Fis family transcriptional regulator [Deltaproteobacteria bacterium]